MIKTINYYTNNNHFALNDCYGTNNWLKYNECYILSNCYTTKNCSITIGCYGQNNYRVSKKVELMTQILVKSLKNSYFKLTF